MDFVEINACDPTSSFTHQLTHKSWCRDTRVYSSLRVSSILKGNPPPETSLDITHINISLRNSARPQNLPFSFVTSVNAQVFSLVSHGPGMSAMDGMISCFHSEQDVQVK